MDAGRIASGTFCVDLQPVALAPIVAGALDLVAVAAEAKHVRVEPLIEPVGVVLGDERRIQQVVTNLVSNAINVESAGEGRGATFVVSLPIARAPAASRSIQTA